jgi:hypothetical protein
MTKVIIRAIKITKVLFQQFLKLPLAGLGDCFEQSTKLLLLPPNHPENHPPNIFGQAMIFSFNFLDTCSEPSKNISTYRIFF